MMHLSSHMQVISIADTESGVKITHRAFPAAVEAVFCLAALLFVLFVLANVNLAEGSWLPPFDRLSDMAKRIVQFLCIAAGMAIITWPIVKGVRILLGGGVWDFDVKRQLVTRAGTVVVSFGEIRSLRIEGDSNRDTPMVTLAIITRSGRTIEIAQGTLSLQAECFVAVARRVRDRTQIPFEARALGAFAT